MECDLGLIFKIADDTGAGFVGGNCEVDFLYMNSREPAVELDVQKEIVSGDAFFGRAKECVTGDRETLLYRQEFFRDVLQINELPEFLSALHAKLNEIPCWHFITWRTTKSGPQSTAGSASII